MASLSGRVSWMEDSSALASSSGSIESTVSQITPAICASILQYDFGTAASSVIRTESWLFFCARNVNWYLTRKEPICLLGDTGTGKTHLAIGLSVAACRQRKRVRFTTAAEMVTELIEAQCQNQLSRARNRWLRYDLVVIDEFGYVVMPDAAAELLFQVIAGRAEQAAVIVTTNLPFSEWTTKIPNARLCKAMLDRLTDQAHIIDTGKDSYRFLRTLARKGGKA